LSLRFALQKIDVMLHFFEDVAFNDQEGRKDVHDENIEEKNLAHGGVESRAGATHDDGGRMLRAPPANGKEDERDVEESENAEQCAQKSAPVGLLDEGAEKQIGNIEQPQDESRGKARVPGPPDTPDGVGPNGAGDEDNGDAHKADFGASNPEPVVFGTALPNVKQVGNKADEQGGLTGPGGGGMKIKNPLDEAHGALRRSDEKVSVGSRNDQENGGHAKSKRGRSNSRMRAWAEMAESAVPTIETPRLPRKRTSSR